MLNKEILKRVINKIEFKMKKNLQSGEELIYVPVVVKTSEHDGNIISRIDYKSILPDYNEEIVNYNEFIEKIKEVQTIEEFEDIDCSKINCVMCPLSFTNNPRYIPCQDLTLEEIKKFIRRK